MGHQIKLKWMYDALNEQDDEALALLRWDKRAVDLTEYVIEKMQKKLKDIAAKVKRENYVEKEILEELSAIEQRLNEIH